MILEENKWYWINWSYDRTDNREWMQYLYFKYETYYFSDGKGEFIAGKKIEGPIGHKEELVLSKLI